MTHKLDQIELVKMLLPYVVLVLLIFSGVIQSQSVIKTLPGFPGELPFLLETGYIGVGEYDEVQLFYYYIESERNLKDDPLVLWLTGGPGCSALSGLLYEIGTFTFNYANSSGSKPVLELNPYSWTKVANIIFLDQPVGTGYSYGKTWEAYNNNDTQSATQTYDFLKKWLINHPRFLDNPFYVGGDSYCGIITPIVAQKIYEGNEVRDEPRINIKGYLLGNPFTDQLLDYNSKYKFAHRMGLLSNELYESVKANCEGEYLEVDPNNTLCANDIQVVEECLEKIREPQILEPWCGSWGQEAKFLSRNLGLLDENSIDLLFSSSQLLRPWCRNYNYLLSYTWANDKDVQRALHVREGTISEWVRCNKTLSYTAGDKQSKSHAYAYNVKTSIDYHRNLTNKHCRALIYSGDHDMVVPHVGTEEWIQSLNLPIEIHWKPWFVEDQIAGYKMKYVKNDYQLTYATVKGGGHTAPEYKPKQCLAMVDRWFANYPL
ncbi:hypothetical protein LguiA_027197 [Lonicera macranthoides]